jgi:hypothetical protein
MLAFRLTDLSRGTDGFTSAWGASLAEAVSVCMEDQRHRSGVILQLTGIFDDVYQIIWDPTHPAAFATWNDDQYRTEHGAYGIAMLVTSKLMNLVVKERSRKGTRFDFFLAPRERPTFLAQDAEVRLEVSGIRHGTEGDIQRRLTEKRQRYMKVAARQLLVIVVEFGAPQSAIVSYES